MKRVGLTAVPEKTLMLDHQAKIKHLKELLERQVLPYLQAHKKHSGSKSSPRCFISYAWGEEAHELWVKELAELLEKAGLTLFLDRWEDKPGKILNNFIEKIEEADWVIVVGTKLYLEKYNKQAANLKDKEHVVRLEAQLIEYLIGYNTAKGNKVVPILLEGSAEECFPFMMRPKIPSLFTKNDYFAELLKLIQALHGVDNRDKAFVGFLEDIKRYATAAEVGIQPAEQTAFAEKEEQQFLQQDAATMADLARHKQSLLLEAPKVKPVINLGSSSLWLEKERIDWNLPSQTNHFIGRKALLQELAQTFPPLGGEPKIEREILAITTAGLGGVGKTWLALKYLEDQAQLYSLRVWFSAENKGVLEQQYLGFAKKLGYVAEKASIREAIDYVKNQLLRNPGWLLVFDNVAEYKDIEAYLPKGQGHILITSRYQRWPGKIKTVEVKVLEESEALALLRVLIKKEPESEAEQALVKTLGYLPLAIAQAGAYIQQCGISVAEYLSRYQKYQKEMLEDKRLPEGIQHDPIAITWQVSFEAIKKASSHFSQCASLMTMCAYLSPEAIPRQLLLSYLKKQNVPAAEFVLDECLSQLKAYSLIQLAPNNGPLYLHRLVQTVIRVYHQIGALEKITIKFPALNLDWYNQLLGTVHATFNSESPPLKKEALERTLFPHLEALVEHYKLLKVAPRLELAFMLFDMGLVLLRAGNPAAAKAYLERTLVIQERHYGKEHVAVAGTLNNLAMAFGDLGNTQEKKHLLERALVIKEQHYGKEHVQVASTLVNLANAFGALGDTQEKKRLLERALVIFEREYPPNHPYIAKTLFGLSQVYEKLQDFSQQKTLLERTLKIEEQHYGATHPELISTLKALGKVSLKLKDFKSARAFVSKALALQEKRDEKDPKVSQLTQILENIRLLEITASVSAPSAPVMNDSSAAPYFLPSFNAASAASASTHVASVLNGLVQDHSPPEEKGGLVYV